MAGFAIVPWGDDRALYDLRRELPGSDLSPNEDHGALAMTEYQRAHFEADAYVARVQTGPCFICQLVADFDEVAYLRLQSLVYRVGRAVSSVLPTERLYVLSLGSKQGNAHVHWHVAPLPPGVPYEKQQFRALMQEEDGYFGSATRGGAALAARIAGARGEAVRRSPRRSCDLMAPSQGCHARGRGPLRSGTRRILHRARRLASSLGTVESSPAGECSFCDLEGFRRSQSAWKMLTPRTVSSRPRTSYRVAASSCPVEHRCSPFELSPEEWRATYDLLVAVKQVIAERWRPDGYTVGLKVGAAGGQEISHAHLHVIHASMTSRTLGGASAGLSNRPPTGAPTPTHRDAGLT